MHVTVVGFEMFPVERWQFGMPSADLVDMAKFQQRAPGVMLPKPAEPGLIVLVLENRSPAVIKMGKGNNIVLQLRQRDLAKGQFTYEDKLQSLQVGAFDIRGTVTPFLKPVTGTPAQ
jgi:hypothetical protein